MRIVYHLGAHCTDASGLMRTLLRNKGVLAGEGIAVAGTSRYRPALRNALQSLGGKPAPPELQRSLLETAFDDPAPARAVFSNPSFLGAPAHVLAQNRLYPRAGELAKRLARLFPETAVEFHLAIRNPATFLPALFAASREERFADFTAGVEPRGLRWSETVARLRRSVPGCRLSVWCNEDLPLIRPEVLRAISGHGFAADLAGEQAFLDALMTEEGAARLKERLRADPPQDPAGRRRVVAGFLEAFGLAEMFEEEIDLPGWSPALIEELTASYEADLAAIRALPDIEVILP